MQINVSRKNINLNCESNPGPLLVISNIEHKPLRRDVQIRNWNLGVHGLISGSGKIVFLKY